jgi:hypothetical protein
MCQSAADGGKRCAPHTREAYQQAFRAVLKYSRKPRDVEALSKVAVEYAMSDQGYRAISRDLEKFEERLELAGTLRSALKKADVFKEAKTDADALIRKAKGFVPAATKGSVDGTPPEPISWSVENPIWPNKETTTHAIKGLATEPTYVKFLSNAYRSIFKSEWDKFFFRRGTFPEPPESNTEGWEWRRSATVVAEHAIAGASIIRADQVQPGMVVYDSHGVHTVAEVKDREVRRKGMRELLIYDAKTITYTDDDPGVVVPLDSLLVLLPNHSKVAHKAK